MKPKGKKMPRLHRDRYVRVTLYLTPDEYTYLNVLRGRLSWREFAIGDILREYYRRKTTQFFKKEGE